MLLKSVQRQRQTRLPISGLRRNWFKFGSVMAGIPVPVIEVNPPGIVTITASSFTVDATKMKTFFPYIVEFQSVKYMIWKDERNALIETVLE